MNLKASKFLHHLNGKLRTGNMTATVGYVENFLIGWFSNVEKTFIVLNYYIILCYITLYLLHVCILAMDNL